MLGSYSQILDLSQPWSTETPAFPTDPDPQVRWVKRLTTHGTNHQEIETTLHAGTHIDAPLHFLNDGGDIESIDLKRLVGSGLVVDISGAVQEHGLITPEMIEARAHVEQGDIVILHTGYHRNAFCEAEADMMRYFFKHPGGDERLADWIVNKDIAFLGVDMASPDHVMNSNLRELKPSLASEASEVLGAPVQEIFPEESFQVMHTRLFAAGIPIVENIGGEIDRVVNRRVVITAVPWRFRGGEAAMVRVLAFLP